MAAYEIKAWLDSTTLVIFEIDGDIFEIIDKCRERDIRIVDIKSI